MLVDKDPNATLDYSRDWNRNAAGAADGTGWLGAGETITASTWVIESKPDDPNPLSQATPAPSQVAGKATIWLSGGTAGKRYKVTNRIVTSQGRTDERTTTVDVKEK